MGAFNTDIAKYANNLLHSKDCRPLLEGASADLASGIFTQDDKGNTILHYLATKNALNAFDAAIKFIDTNYKQVKFKSGQEAVKSALDIPNHKGMRVSHIIFGFNSSDLVKYLVDYKANIEAENLVGDRPLEIAAAQDKIESIQAFYNISQSQFCNTYRGKSLLQIALESDSDDVFRFLLGKNDLGYLQMLDYQRNNILHIAASLGRIEYVRKILNTDININLKNGSSITAAEIAYNAGFIDVVAELLRHGAEISSDIAYNIGYKTVENITQTVISAVVDSYGTFVGISQDKNKVQTLKDKIINLVADMRIIERDKISQKLYELVDGLIDNLRAISGTKITRNIDEIKKILSPILNEFVKEAAYV